MGDVRRIFDCYSIRHSAPVDSRGSHAESIRRRPLIEAPLAMVGLVRALQCAFLVGIGLEPFFMVC